MADPDPLYAACYCEENVWHLCGDPSVRGEDRQVLWITNELRSCPFLGQRAARHPGEAVWWDYHVVLVSRSDTWILWDLDTVLGFPVDLRTWLHQTFGPPGSIVEPFAPRFRVIAADVYVARFSSDRSHMRRADGSWLAAPPPWPPIDRGDRDLFAALLDPRSSVLGDVLTREGLEGRFDLFDSGPDAD